MVSIYTRKRRREDLQGGGPIKRQGSVAARRFAAEEELRRRALAEEAAAKSLRDAADQNAARLKALSAAEAALQRGPVENIQASAEDAVRRNELDDELNTLKDAEKLEEARKAAASIESENIQKNALQDAQEGNRPLNPADNPLVIHVPTPEELAKAAADQKAALEAAARNQITEDLKVSSAQLVAAGKEQEAAASAFAAQETKTYAQRYAQIADLALNTVVKPILTAYNGVVSIGHYFAVTGKRTASSDIDTLKAVAEDSLHTTNADASKVMKAVLSESTSLSDLLTKVVKLNTDIATIRENDNEQRLRIANAELDVGNIQNVELPNLEKTVVDLTGQLGPISDRIRLLELAKEYYRDSAFGELQHQISDLKAKQTSINEKIQSIRNEIDRRETQILPALSADAQKQQDIRATAQAAKEDALTNAANAIRNGSANPDRSALTIADNDVASLTSGLTSVSARRDVEATHVSDAQEALLRAKEPSPNAAASAGASDVALRATTALMRKSVYDTLIKPNFTDADILVDIQRQLDSLLPSDLGNTYDEALKRVKTTMAAAEATAAALKTPFDNATSDSRLKAAAAAAALRDSVYANRALATLQSTIDKNVATANKLLIEAKFLQDKITERNAAFNHTIATYEAAFAAAKKAEFTAALENLTPPTRPATSAEDFARSLAAKRGELEAAQAKTGPAAALRELQSQPDHASTLADTESGAYVAQLAVNYVVQLRRDKQILLSTLRGALRYLGIRPSIADRPVDPSGPNTQALNAQPGIRQRLADWMRVSDLPGAKARSSDALNEVARQLTLKDLAVNAAEGGVLQNTGSADAFLADIQRIGNLVQNPLRSGPVRQQSIDAADEASRNAATALQRSHDAADALTMAEQIKGTLPDVPPPINNVPSEISPPSHTSVEDAEAIKAKAAIDSANANKKRIEATNAYIKAISNLGKAYDAFSAAGMRHGPAYDAVLKANDELNSAQDARKEVFDTFDSANKFLDESQKALLQQYAAKAGFMQYIVTLGNRYSIQSVREAEFLKAQKMYEKFTSLDNPSPLNARAARVQAEADAAAARNQAMDAVQRATEAAAAAESTAVRLSEVPAPPDIPVASPHPIVADPRKVISDTEEALAAERGQLAALEAPRTEPPAPGPLPSDTHAAVEAQLKAAITSRDATNEALRQQDPAGAAAVTLSAEGALKTAVSERDALVAAGADAPRLVTGGDPAGFLARTGADTAAAGAALDTVRSEIPGARSHAETDADALGEAGRVLSSKEDAIPTVNSEPVRTLEESLVHLSAEIHDLPLKIAEYDRILAGINIREGSAAFVRAQNKLAGVKAELTGLLDPSGRLDQALRELDQKFNDFLQVQGIHNGNAQFNSNRFADLEAAINTREWASAALGGGSGPLRAAQDDLASQLSMRDMQNDMLASLRIMITERRNIDLLIQSARSIRDSSSSSADSYRALKDAIRNRTVDSSRSLNAAGQTAIRIKNIASVFERSRNTLEAAKNAEKVPHDAVARLQAERLTTPEKPPSPEPIEQGLRTEGTQLRELQDAGARPRPPETPRPVDSKAPVERALNDLRASRDATAENLRRIDPEEAAAATEEAQIALADALAARPIGADNVINNFANISDVFDAVGIRHLSVDEAFNDLMHIGDIFEARGGNLRRAIDNRRDAEARAREAARQEGEARQALEQMGDELLGAGTVREGVRAELEGASIPARIDNVPVEIAPPATVRRPTESEIELSRIKSAFNVLENRLKNANDRKNSLALAKAYDKFLDSFNKFRDSKPDDTLLKKAKQDVADAMKKLLDADPVLIQRLHDLAVQRHNSLENLDTVYKDYLKVIENRTRNFLEAAGKLKASLERAALMKKAAADAGDATRLAEVKEADARKLALQNADKVKYLVDKLKAEKQALRDLLSRRDRVEGEIDFMNKKMQLDAIEQLKRLKELGGEIFERIRNAKKRIDDAEANRRRLEDEIARKRNELENAIKKYGADSNEVKRLKDELDALKKNHDDALKKLNEANDALKKLKDIADQLDRLRKEIEHTISTLKDELGRRNKDPGIFSELLGALAALTGLQLLLLAAAVGGIGAMGVFGLVGAMSGVNVQSSNSSDYSEGFLDGENTGRQNGSADGNTKGTQDYNSALATRNANSSANARVSGQDALAGAAGDAGSNTNLAPEEAAPEEAAPDTAEDGAVDGAVDSETQEVSPDDVVLQEGGQEEQEPTEEQPAEEQPTEEQPTDEQPIEEQPIEEQPIEEPEDEQDNDEGNAAGSALGESAAQSASQEPEAIETPDPVPVPNPVVVRGMPFGKDEDYQQGYNDGYKSIYPDAFTTTYTSVFANPPEKGLGDVPTVPQIPQEDVSGCADLSGNPDLSGNTDLSGCADTSEENVVHGNPNATMVDLQKGPEDVEEVEQTPEDDAGAEPKSLSVSRVLTEDDTVDPTVGGGDPVDRVEPTL